jgi:hypothetical protein
MRTRLPAVVRVADNAQISHLTYGYDADAFRAAGN